MSDKLALDVQNLSVSFPMRGRGADGRRRALLAVDNVNFSIARGKTLGIVGEVGSGKTLPPWPLRRWLPSLPVISPSPAIISGPPKTKRRPQRVRRTQLFFQTPSSSLTPRRRRAELSRYQSSPPC